MDTRSGTKRRADDGDAEEKTVSLPVFTPITAPRITKASHQFLVQWRKTGASIVEKVRARCQTTGGDEDGVLTAVMNSFEDGLLDALCKYRWRVKKEDLTEERVLQEIDAILSTVKNAILPDIRALFRNELSMDLKETDVKERVLQYFKRCEEIILDNCLSDCFEGESGMKEKCKLLIASLEPTVVREEVETTVRFQKREAQRDDVVLHDVILEKALENEKSFHRRKKARHGDSVSTTESGKAPKPKADQKQKKAKKASNTLQWTGQSGTKTSKISASEMDSLNKGPADGCLKCGEDHWLSACREASAAEKISLPQEHAKKKAAERAQKSTAAPKRVKRINPCLPSTVKYVSLNGVRDVPYCADSGSDLTYISRYHAMKLVELDRNVTIYPLATPVVSSAVGNQELISREALRAQLTIGTAAGVVTIAEARECLILESCESELILGLDVLNTLGINIENQLERLAARESGADEHPMPFEDDDGVNVSDKQELMSTIEEMLVRALKEGFPEALLGELRRIVFLYDIWRVALGRDPPARVPPLKIRLREWATSYRCKARNYPPHLRQFMKEFNDELVKLGWIVENKEA